MLLVRRPCIFVIAHHHVHVYLFILNAAKLSEYLIINTDYLAGRLYLCISKYNRGSQNGSYFTYWNNKADFIRGTIFPNDRRVSQAKGIPCLYVPHLIRYMQITLTCIIHCTVI